MDVLLIVLAIWDRVVCRGLQKELGQFMNSRQCELQVITAGNIAGFEKRRCGGWCVFVFLYMCACVCGRVGRRRRVLLTDMDYVSQADSGTSLIPEEQEQEAAQLPVDGIRQVGR